MDWILITLALMIMFVISPVLVLPIIWVGDWLIDRKYKKYEANKTTKGQ